MHASRKPVIARLTSTSRNSAIVNVIPLDNVGTPSCLRPNLNLSDHSLALLLATRFGYPAEFRRRAQLLDEIGPEGVTDFIAFKDSRFSRPLLTRPDHPPGTFTDDTQMAIAVGASLLHGSQCGLDQLMAKMGRRFVSWSRSDNNNRAPGATCMEGCVKLSLGVHWRDAVVAESNGCGSAMRVAIIGLYYKDLDQV